MRSSCRRHGDASTMTSSPTRNGSRTMPEPTAPTAATDQRRRGLARAPGPADQRRRARRRPGGARAGATAAGSGPSTAGSPGSPTSCAATTSCSTRWSCRRSPRGAPSIERSLDTLAADHAWIDQLLSDLGDALGILSFGLGAEAWWIGKASDLAAALHHVLDGPAEPGGAPADAAGRPLVRRPPSATSCSARRCAPSPPGRCRFSLAWLYTHVDDAERAAVTAYLPATSRLSWRSRRKASSRSAVAVR